MDCPLTSSPAKAAEFDKELDIRVNNNSLSPSLTRAVIDPIEDSGLGSHAGSIGDESTAGQLNKIDDDGFVNVDMEEMKRKQAEERLKYRKQQNEENRLAKESFEAEIQEKQYKRLMLLLQKSKAFAQYVGQKNQSQPGPSKPSRKRSHKVSVLQKKENEAPKKNQRGKSKKAKLNLSQDEIEEHLENVSDDNEDNEDISEDFPELKYFEGDLRPYQKIGVKWLISLYENGLNGILADEMGLGKTIQIIALLAYLLEKKIPGPYMIVIPLSTLPNWKSEFKRFAPKLPVVIYHGSKANRPALRPLISKKYALTETFKTNPIVILTYQTPIVDSTFLKKFTWKYIIVDEGQRIKNNKCQLGRVFSTLLSSNRLLLTGTPLQNDLSELWSLLHFLLPEIFNDLAVFQAWFDPKNVSDEQNRKKFFQQEQEKRILESLREILQPFMLRRVKEVVCPEIPPSKEVVVYTPLTRMQYDLYHAVILRNIAMLTKQKQEEKTTIVDVDGVRPKRKCVLLKDIDYYYSMERSDTSSSDLSIDTYYNNTKADVKIKQVNNEDISVWKQYADINSENREFIVRIKMSNPYMMCRHITNHPYLIHYPLNDCGQFKIDEDITKASGKLLVLDLMLKKLKARGHKILFFTNFTMVLDIIQDYLSMRPYKYVMLNGSCKLEDRDKSIKAFNNDPEVFLFLMTTRAGSVGLNLASADTVIIYDTDWNPQCDLQAMARCHRIGQTRPVVTYRLCTKGTTDEAMINRAQAKRFLEKAIISDKHPLAFTKDTLQRLEQILEENKLNIVTSKKNVYTDEELDKILDRTELLKQHEDNIKKLK